MNTSSFPRLLRVSTISLLAFASLLPVSAQVTINSNGTGGGDWATGSTWVGGSVPPNFDSWVILTGDTVTAGSDAFYNNASRSNVVYGTLNINTGASITIARLNPSATSSGTINVAGGSFSVDGIANSAVEGTLLTINVSAGSLTTRSTNAGIYSDKAVINLSGGTVNYAATQLKAATHITGGTMILNGVTGTSSLTGFATSTWNGGTVAINTSSLGNQTQTNNLINRWGENAANVLALSSKTEKQTLALGGNASLSQGNLHVNLYSATDSDNDQINFASHSLTLGSNVQISLFGTSLTGTVEDYLGTSYKLFDGSSSYDNINASIAATVLNIGGADYTVGWINNLSTDGTLTIDTLSVIPEPSTYAFLGGLSALGLCLLRRRRL